MAQTTEHLIDTTLAGIRAASNELAGVAKHLSSNQPDALVVNEVLAEVRFLQRLAAGIVTALTQAALVNASEGRGPVVEDVLGGDGTVGRNETRAEIARARVAAQFPATASGLAEGSVHTGNVDVLARMTARMTDEELGVLSERDNDIAEAAGRLGEDSFRKRVQRMRDRIRSDHGRTAAEQAVDDSFARVSLSRDRTNYRIAGQLDGLRGSAVQAALAREFRWLNNQPELVKGLDGDQAMAKALHDLIMRGDGVDRETCSTRANVSVLVLTDRQTLETGPHKETVAETEDGTPLDPATVGRLCCDAGLRRLDTLPDAQVHVSHSARTANPAQNAALRAMYSGCPISGAPWSQCEIHHTVFYRDSGRTVLSELVPISRRWHHLVHEGGWTLTMNTERTLTLSRPDRTTHKTIPYKRPDRTAQSSEQPADRTKSKEHALAA